MPARLIGPRRPSGAFYKKRPTVKNPRVKGVSKTAAAAVRKIAKAVVKRETEDKYVSTQGAVLFNSSITSSSECYPMIPQITEGTGDFQRIGDKVRGKYLYIKGYLQYNLNYLEFSTGNQYLPPVTARVMILSQKNVKVGNDVSTRIDVAHLLKDNVGTGTARPYNGGLLDNLAPINKDLFKVHMDKKIKLNWVQRGDQTNTGDTGFGIGNDRTKYFRCRIKLPASMTFDDGNLDWPNNCAPFLCFGAVNDDGTTKYTVGTPFRLGWISTAYFEDA